MKCLQMFLKEVFIYLYHSFFWEPYYYYYLDFAEGLKEIQDVNKNVQIGSYPSFNDSKWKVKLTIEGTDKDVVENVKKEVENLLSTFSK